MMRSESLVSHCRNLGFYSECGVVRTKRGSGQEGEGWGAKRGPLYLSQPYVLHLPLPLPCFGQYILSRWGKKSETFILSLSLQ